MKHLSQVKAPLIFSFFATLFLSVLSSFVVKAATNLSNSPQQWKEIERDGQKETKRDD